MDCSWQGGSCAALFPRLAPRANASGSANNGKSLFALRVKFFIALILSEHEARFASSQRVSFQESPNGFAAAALDISHRRESKRTYTTRQLVCSEVWRCCGERRIRAVRGAPT